MADLATLYPDGRPAEWFRQARRCFTGRRNGYLIIDENDRSRLGVYNAFAKEFPKRTSLYSSAHPHFYAMANREFSRNTLYRVYFEEERIVPAVDVLRSRADAERLSDTIKLAGARSEKSPVIVALGTDWIKGYEKDRYLQYDALNPLVISIRRFCEANGMTFIDRKDDELPAEIEKARQGEKNAKVIVLAGEETVKSGGFGGLRDDENALLIGVDNSGLTVDSYIRLIEMLDISFKLAFGRGSEVNMDNPHIRVKKDPRFRNLYIMLPKAEPMNYESLRELYRVQIFA
jgi:hypothetical protein